MPNKILNTLLETENQQLKKLNDIVLQSIEEEKLISEKLYAFEESNPTFSNKLADRIAMFGGSWYFILAFLVVMMTWMVVNVLFTRFDPYPFILLNLLLSTIAALQAPVIMMSQNRKEEKDRQRKESPHFTNPFIHTSLQRGVQPSNQATGVRLLHPLIKLATRRFAEKVAGGRSEA